KAHKEIGLEVMTSFWPPNTPLAPLRLSPFDLLRYNSYLALAFVNFVSGRFGDAVAAAMTGLQANPAFTPMHAFLIASQVGLGRIEDGKASAARLLEL